MNKKTKSASERLIMLKQKNELKGDASWQN